MLEKDVVHLRIRRGRFKLVGVEGRRQRASAQCLLNQANRYLAHIAFSSQLGQKLGAVLPQELVLHLRLLVSELLL